MTLEELTAWKQAFKSATWLQGEVTCETLRIQRMSRWDVNGSHSKAIIMAQERRNELRAKQKEKLAGYDYKYMMLALRKATRMSKKKDQTDFINFDIANAGVQPLLLQQA